MFEVEKAVEEFSKGLILLTSTHEITKQDIDMVKKYAWLNTQYKNSEKFDAVIKAAISVINSILYQERLFFCLTRADLKNLIASDKNWTTENTFSERNYPKIIAFLIKSKVIEQISYEGFNSRKPAMYKLVDSGILGLLQIDVLNQEQETLAFVQRNKSNSSEGLLVASEGNAQVEVKTPLKGSTTSIRSSPNEQVSSFRKHIKSDHSPSISEEINKPVQAGGFRRRVAPVSS